MAAKKTSKARKTVSRAKATKKSTVRSSRKAPGTFSKLSPGQYNPQASIQINE